MEFPKEVLEPQETELKMGNFIRYLLRRNAGYLWLPLYAMAVYKAWPGMNEAWRYGAVTVGLVATALSFFLFIWGALWFSKNKKEWFRKNKEQRDRVLAQVDELEATWIALASVWNGYGAWQQIGHKEPKELHAHVESIRKMKAALLIQHNPYPITGIDAFPITKEF